MHFLSQPVALHANIAQRKKVANSVFKVLSFLKNNKMSKQVLNHIQLNHLFHQHDDHNLSAKISLNGNLNGSQNLLKTNFIKKKTSKYTIRCKTCFESQNIKK